MSEWILVKRPCGEVFANKSRQIWIVKYQETEPAFLRFTDQNNQLTKKNLAFIKKRITSWNI